MLTSRQFEFLKTVVSCTESSGVHYTEIAQVLGVSKWTAYDILTNLSAQGLLEKRRESKETKTVGRMKVLFYPTPRGEEIVFSSQEFEKSGDIEWDRVCKHLKSKVRESRERGVFPVLSEVLKELSFIRKPLTFCAYLIVVMLLTVRMVSNGPENSLWIHTLIPLLVGPQVALLVFSGTLVTLILQCSPNMSIRGKVLQFVPIFECYFKKLDVPSEKILLNFTLDIIRDLWPSQFEVVQG